MIRIVAAAEGIPLNHFQVVPRQNIGLDPHLSHFPLSRGKIPGLRGPGIAITEVIAITTVRSPFPNRIKTIP